MKPTYIGNHDDIQAKIKAGGGSYDLITYYQGYKDLYTELEILTNDRHGQDPEHRRPLLGLQGSRTPGTCGSKRTATGRECHGPGGRSGSPGTTRGSRAASPRGTTFSTRSSRAGSRWSTTRWARSRSRRTSSARTRRRVPKDEYAEIRDYLTKMVAQAKTVSPGFTEMTNALVDGEADVCYQGWAYQNYLAAQAGHKTVKTKTPKEGAFSFCDLYAIPSTTDNSDTVARLDQRVARPGDERAHRRVPRRRSDRRGSGRPDQRRHEGALSRTTTSSSATRPASVSTSSSSSPRSTETRRSTPTSS